MKTLAAILLFVSLAAVTFFWCLAKASKDPESWESEDGAEKDAGFNECENCRHYLRWCNYCSLRDQSNPKLCADFHKR